MIYLVMLYVSLSIYFTEIWVYKFNQKTEKKDFKNFDNTKIQVNTMENLFTDILIIKLKKFK